MTKNPVQVFPRKRVKAILRRLGLRPVQGDGTGHEVWVDPQGHCYRPVLRHNDVPYSQLFTLGRNLEFNGVCLRRDFLASVKSGTATMLNA